MKTQIRVLITGATLAPLSCIIAQENNRPNILWIVSEDNTTFLGCYGDNKATTPNIDQLAREGVLYTNAYCTSPVSAPSRSSLITGMYPVSVGSHNMRSNNQLPGFFEFYTHKMRQAGYYCINRAKEDYNTSSNYSMAWDESSQTASWKNRKPEQPFFQVINTELSHERSIFKHKDKLDHNPLQMDVPPYLPDLPEIRYDRALYYDRITEMDEFVAKQLKALEDDGLAENTIVFYYGDNGGVLGRSKRFCYENGLHVPLIIRFPKKFQHLAPASPGQKSDRMVSFVDFPATMLSLTGIKIPDYLQGIPFLGDQQKKERKYIYGFRDRMDERYDMIRVVRNKQFKYNRNYMPHRVYGQHINYLWQAAGMKAWEKAFLDGKCDELQSRFWKTKPAEELYDIHNDPHETKNLVSLLEYKPMLKQMRKTLSNWELKNFDVGFIPEDEIVERSKQNCPYDLIRSAQFPYKRLFETADKATMGDAKDFPLLISRLSDPESSIRYWAVIGCIVQSDKVKKSAILIKKTKEIAQRDISTSVRIAACESLFRLGNTSEAVQILLNIVKTNSKEFVRLQAYNVADVIGKAADPIRRFAVMQYPKQLPDNMNYDARCIVYWREQGY